MSESIQVPKKLKSAVLFNAANDLLLSFSLFFFPENFIKFSGWLTFDPFALRLIAGGLIAVAIELFLVRKKSAEFYKSALNIKVLTVGIGVIGVSMALVQNNRPPIMAELILFAGLFIPFIQLGYWRLHLSKITSK